MKTATLASLFLGLATAVASVPALAQPAGPQGQAPQQQPAPMAQVTVSGTVAHYIVGPAGHVRAIALMDGTVVWLHGRSGDLLTPQLPVGNAVRVEGLAAPGRPMQIRHASVYAANGALLVAASSPMQQQPGAQGQQQPGGMHGRWRQMDPAARQARRAEMQARLAQLPARSAQGTVQTVITGRRGMVRGLLLSDGTSVFLRGPLAHALAQRGVRVGESVRAAGRGNAYPQGASVLAEQLTFADGTVVTAPVVVTQ